jgi:hypothetical protein
MSHSYNDTGRENAVVAGQLYAATRVKTRKVTMTPPSTDVETILPIFSFALRFQG